MNNITNQTPYLRTSRRFPEELHQLSVEVNKSYVDIANAVNNRTIGIFPVNKPIVTGETWFISSNERQQTLRQVYNISSLTAFNHGINVATISTFTKITGIIYTGTNYLPLPYVDAQTPAVSVGIYVNSTQVLFTVGATPPTVQSGIIVLEWLSQM